MYRTLKFMKSMTSPEYKDMSYEELSEIYKKKQDDSIIAEVFTRSFSMIVQYANKYHIVPEEAGSYALLVIARTLDHFSPGSNKYFTFLCAAVKNKFMYINKRNHNNKNKVTTLISSPVFWGTDETQQELGVEKIKCPQENPYDCVDFYLTYESLSLTPQEKQYIDSIIQGNSRRQTNERLKIDRQTAHIIQKSVSQKLATAKILI